MSDHKNKTRAMKLLMLWGISYMVLGVLSNIYVFYQININKYNPITMLSGYQILSLVIMMVYFIPLLLVVYHYIKLAEMKRIQRIVAALLMLFCGWTAVLLVLTVVALISPTAFS